MSLRFFVRGVPAWAFAAAVVLACQAQGEGAPCSVDNNGSGDCQSGLTCMPVPNVVGTRCCPASGGSSSPDCTGTTGLGAANVPASGADGSVLSDASPAADAPGEASPETSAADTGTDSMQDAAAPAEASADTGSGGD